MKDVYLNPELYDALHNDIGTDENVIKYYAKKCNGPVLEIACGTGRLSKYIIDLGLPYTGIDNSKPFLNVSLEKFGKNGTFLYNDMQDFKLAEKFDLDTGETGIVVVDVTEGSPAADKGVQPGDIIRRLNQSAITSVDKLIEGIASAQKEGRKGVLMLIESDGQTRFVQISFDE